MDAIKIRFRFVLTNNILYKCDINTTWLKVRPDSFVKVKHSLKQVVLV